MDKGNTFLNNTPDFYVEMKWEVNVSFLSFLFPNDTCKIWKKGCNIRMDYTFIKMNNLSCIRAPSSFIYNGMNEKVFVVNWEKNTYFESMEHLDDEEIKLIIDDIMEGTRLNSEFKLKNCMFTPSQNWRGKPVIEIINKWKAQKYNVKVDALFDLHNIVKMYYDNLFDKENYFDLSKPLNKTSLVVGSNEETKEKISKNLKLKSDLVKNQLENFGKNKQKKQNAFVWVAENYPFKLEYMVNMINSLSAANEITEKLKEFFKDPEFQKIVDSGGFPIKIKIPINFFIDVTMTFANYK
jgi:hypothetical protein